MRKRIALALMFIFFQSTISSYVYAQAKNSFKKNKTKPTSATKENPPKKNTNTPKKINNHSETNEFIKIIDTVNSEKNTIKRIELIANTFKKYEFFEFDETDLNKISVAFEKILDQIWQIIPNLPSEWTPEISNYIEIIMKSNFLFKSYKDKNSVNIAELLKWIENGKPVPPTNFGKQLAIKEYKAKFGCNVFIETGTYLGHMVEAQKNNFKQIFSIELSRDLASKAKEFFKNFNHIFIIQGDSEQILKTLVPTLNEPVIFWLNGHYSAGITAKGDKETPILKELDTILSQEISHIILIDDARYFGGKSDYPTLEALFAFIKRKKWNANIEVKNDIIRITPGGKTDKIDEKLLSLENYPKKNYLWNQLESFNPKEEKHFVVLIPSYNNSKWYQKNLDSIFMQKYSNYHILYIDDCSSDGTGDLVEKYVKEMGQEHRVILVKNKVRQKAMANVCMGVWMCADSDIIASCDGDDWWANDHVLELLNKIYQDPNVWMTHGSVYNAQSNQVCQVHGYPEHIITQNLFRENLIVAGLRSYYTWLFKKIKIEDLKIDGQFYPVSHDNAIMSPMFEMAGKRHKFIPDILYIYNTATGINDADLYTNYQKVFGAYIRYVKPKYEPLTKNPIDPEPSEQGTNNSAIAHATA